MKPEEIMKVIDIWYTFDPSYNAAKALHENGVLAKQVFKMKEDFGYEGRTKWFMVFSRLRDLERDKERVNGLREATNPKKQDRTGGNRDTLSGENEDRDSTYESQSGDSILPFQY
jgi:hypothetical protein